MRIFVEYEGHPHPVRQMELAVSPQDTIDHVRALVENFLDTSTQLREFCVAGRLQEASSSLAACNIQHMSLVRLLSEGDTRELLAGMALNPPSDEEPQDLPAEEQPAQAMEDSDADVISPFKWWHDEPHDEDGSSASDARRQRREPSNIIGYPRSSRAAKSGRSN